MLKVLNSKESLVTWRKSISNLGFVPTMGNLHRGHISLVQESFKSHTKTLVSIFVNPTQFNNQEDLKNYPRTLSKDLELLEQLQSQNTDKEIVVFAPIDSTEVYPQNFETHILPGKLAHHLCGLHRPGHFDGVCSVVYCLLQLAGATKAYFGKKDYQQYLIVKKMVHDLSIPTQIIACDLVRDENGLALSSRNNRLSEDQKILGLKLYHSLKSIEKILVTNEFSHFSESLYKIKSEDKNFEYLEVLDASNLETPTSKTEEYFIAGAYYVGDVRLIDNILIKKGNVTNAR